MIRTYQKYILIDTKMSIIDDYIINASEANTILHPCNMNL